MPILLGDEAIGVIAVQSTREEGRFGAADERLLATIGAGVGAAIQNARLYDETRRLYGEAREYLEQVDKVTDAAVALESGEFGSGSLSAVAERDDALGQLAKTFQTMAEEVAAREARLRRRSRSCASRSTKRASQAKVAEITGTDYFKDLRSSGGPAPRRRAPDPVRHPTPSRQHRRQGGLTAYGHDRLSPLVPRRDGQVEHDRERGGGAGQPGQARRRDRRRHPVARHPHALRPVTATT